MLKSQILELEGILTNIPSEKFSMIKNFILWLQSTKEAMPELEEIVESDEDKNAYKQAIMDLSAGNVVSLEELKRKYS